MLIRTFLEAKKGITKIVFFFSIKLFFIKLMMEHISTNSFVVKCQNSLTKSYLVNLYTIYLKNWPRKELDLGAFQFIPCQV